LFGETALIFVFQALAFIKKASAATLAVTVFCPLCSALIKAPDKGEIIEREEVKIKAHTKVGFIVRY
jgi:hypothetical protein